MVTHFAVPILRQELAHRQEKEVGNKDLDIEWEVRHGKEHQRSQSGAAEKGNFFYKAEGPAVDYANS